MRLGLQVASRELSLLGKIDDVVKDSRCVASDLRTVLRQLPPLIELDPVERPSWRIAQEQVGRDLLRADGQHVRIGNVDAVPIFNDDVALYGADRLVKRVLDVLASSLALLVLAIPLAIIAALVKLTSRGPVFYRQVRIGLGGKPFTIVKFRSMYDDVEKETGPVWAERNDPRVTPLGALLRRANLDELPQLWNVLRGDMSIVGPRPERPHFVEYFQRRIPQYMLRHTVKGGLTGWAQVNGWRGNTPVETRIEYDLYYIKQWSLRLDLKIMWLTLLRGFFHEHAY
jgi:exopolysaccharide biosynthesis polyprenyl glycosylphosphotransferase